jgi:multidrug efflux pump subunit AcrB
MVTFVRTTPALPSSDVARSIEAIGRDDNFDALYLANYANINIVDALYRVKGVGDVRIFGAGEYAMRIWLQPDRLAAMAMTVPEVA